MDIYPSIITTPIGNLSITWKDEMIHLVEFTEDLENEVTMNSNLETNIIEQFTEYFNGQRKMFDLECFQDGTEFQMEVWQEIMKIPYGKTKTYTDIAVSLGRPSSYRAVANACGQNRIPIIIPCHRVIGKNNLGGYRYNTCRKEWLLELEKCNI